MLPFYEKIDQNIRAFRSKGLHFPLHLHSQLELVYVLENEIQIAIHTTEKTFHKGDFIIIFPNTIHSYESHFPEESAGESVLIVICDLIFTGDFLNTISNYHPHTSYILSSKLHEDVVFAMDALVKESNQVKNLSACKAFIQLILSRSLSKLDLVKNRNSDSYDLTYQIVNYISQNFHEHLSLDMLADELCVSKYHLSRIFSNKLNTNFCDYVNSIRLNYAAPLLRTTDNSITQICSDSGFDSQRTFNRVFKETYLMTPREYRYQ
jgi:AraC-like DNA-binding protein